MKWFKWKEKTGRGEREEEVRWEGNGTERNTRKDGGKGSKDRI
jgi:hypothetical protein